MSRPWNDNRRHSWQVPWEMCKGFVCVKFCTEGAREGIRERDGGRKGRHKYHCPWGWLLALHQHLTCYNHFLKSASHASPRPTIPMFGHNSRVERLFMSSAWLNISPYMQQNTHPLLFFLLCSAVQATNMFSFTSDGYLPNTTDTSRRLDMCIIASTIHYACRHTPHLKHCRQQESLAACQLWLMWSPS